MSVLSVLRCAQPILCGAGKYNKVLTELSRVTRLSHVRVMEIKEGEWRFKRMKNFMSMYFYVGVIMWGSIALFANVFVGPAQLAEIPEGYRPKHWEYFRHPITRFIAQHLQINPQQEYEKTLAFMYEKDYRAQVITLDKKIDRLIKERKDYKAYYYRPISANFAKIAREDETRAYRHAGHIDDNS